MEELAAPSDLFEFAPVAYLVTDATGTITEANETASDVLGVDAAGILGKPFTTFVPDSSRNEFSRALLALARRAVTAQSELELETQAGRRFHAAVTVAPAQGGPKPGTLRWVIRDVSERVQSERRERAERDFVTNAAHELQSPLAAITSAIEVLQSGAKETPNRDLFLDHIDRETQRLGRLVRSLLTLARAETAVETPRSELIELCPLLEAIAERMDPAEGVSLTVDCTEELAVLSNRDLLEQAVSNLVRNSIKYTSAGTIRLSAAREDGSVQIRVVDTGTGISEEALPRVFERFYRSDSTREGFGLGLAIVRASVEILGGDVDIDSTPGAGTEVRMRLPAVASLVGPVR